MASFIYDLFHRLHCFISVAIGIIGYIADFGVAFLHHCIRDLSNIRGVEIFFLLHDGYLQLQSNSVNTDTEGAIESVHINGVSLLSGLNLKKNVRTFLPQRQSKLSVIMMCAYKAGVCKSGV